MCYVFPEADPHLIMFMNVPLGIGSPRFMRSFYLKECESSLLQTLRHGSVNISEICHVSSFTWVNVCGIQVRSPKCAFVA